MSTPATQFYRIEVKMGAGWHPAGGYDEYRFLTKKDAQETLDAGWKSLGDKWKRTHLRIVKVGEAAP